MAKIVFFLDFDLGHVYPTLALARSLQKRGHEVCYLGIADVAKIVRAHAFDFETILEDIYPEGEIRRLRCTGLTLGPALGNRPARVYTAHLGPLADGALDRALERLAPDVVIVGFFLAPESLVVAYRYQLPLVLFTPMLRRPELPPAVPAVHHLTMLPPKDSSSLFQLALRRRPQLRSLEELVEPIGEATELLACPRELEIPGRDCGNEVTYIGPSVVLDRVSEEDADWICPGDRNLIYVAIGSQGDLFPKQALHVLREVVEMARRWAEGDWHFVISLGRWIELRDLGEVPANTTVAPWIPQLKVLKRASLMVTHGGLGSLKECILHGVPVVVVPFINDQTENAERVCHHRIGRRLDPAEVTAERLAETVRETLACVETWEKMRGMMRVFAEQAACPIGAERIERLLGALQ